MSMRASTHRGTRRRPGFTLVELLVAMGIMVLLATLIVALAPSFKDRQKTQKGADQLQQWLLSSKRMAARAQSPRGLRIMPVDIKFQSTGTVTQAQVTAGTFVTVPAQTSGVTQDGLPWS